MDLLNSPLAADRPRFAAYLEALSSTLGHSDRVALLKAFSTGLLLPGASKSIEPMATRMAPAPVQVTHQALHHLLDKGEWSVNASLAQMCGEVLPLIESHGSIHVWIVDDTGFLKRGRHSGGVGRHYHGQIGKQDNCQIAVTLSGANTHASLPMAYRLYLPAAWPQDAERRRKAGVPKDIRFLTNPDIELDLIRAPRPIRCRLFLSWQMRDTGPIS